MICCLSPIIDFPEQAGSERTEKVLEITKEQLEDLLFKKYGELSLLRLFLLCSLLSALSTLLCCLLFVPPLSSPWSTKECPS